MDEFSEISLPEDFNDSASIGTIVAYQALALSFKQVFKHRLPLIQHDNIKGALDVLSRRLTRNETNSMYPFFHVAIASTGLKEDSHIPKNIQKWGSGFTVDPARANAMGQKHYTFWSETTFDFTAEFQSLQECLAFVDKFTIALATKVLSTGAEIENEVWTVIISGQGQISIPKASTDDESRPAIFQITHQITTYSHIGEIKEVPKLNNEGRMETSLTVNDTVMNRG